MDAMVARGWWMAMQKDPHLEGFVKGFVAAHREGPASVSSDLRLEAKLLRQIADGLEQYGEMYGRAERGIKEG